MRGFGYKFIKKLDTHYSITTEKMLTATDISGNCKAVLGYLDMYLLAGKPFYQDNKTIGKAFHKSPRTIGRILNKLVTQNYIRFNYDKKDNYRIVTKLNLDKIGLTGKCKKVTIHITPYRSRNNYHKIINRPVTHKSSQLIHNTKPVTHHTYPASPSKSASHKLTPTQLATLKSDAKLAAKLFSGYNPQSAMAGFMSKIKKNTNKVLAVNITNLCLALYDVAYRKYISHQTVNEPVAYSCNVSRNTYSSLKQYVSDNKPILDINWDKIQHNKALNKLKKLQLPFMITNGKEVINTDMDKDTFNKKMDKISKQHQYSETTLSDVRNKYSNKKDTDPDGFNYGDDF